MTRPRVEVVGQLRHSDTEGLQFSLQMGKGRKLKTVWVEAVTDAMAWPGIDKTADKDAYFRAVHANSEYRAAADEFFESQKRGPRPIFGGLFWAFRGTVFALNVHPGDVAPEGEKVTFLSKHMMLHKHLCGSSTERNNRSKGATV